MKYWQKEWGKIELTDEGLNDFLNFLKENNIVKLGKKISSNITINNNTLHWLAEGYNAVDKAHNIKTNQLFWEWFSNQYVFKDNEIAIVNLIDNKLKKEPTNEILNISTIIFNSERSEELRYTNNDIYQNNSYLFN